MKIIINSISLKQYNSFKIIRIMDTIVEITVNSLNVNANFRKRRKIESP